MNAPTYNIPGAASAAVASAQSQGAQAVIHCGDIIGANTLRGLQQLGGIHAIGGMAAMVAAAERCGAPFRVRLFVMARDIGAQAAAATQVF